MYIFKQPVKYPFKYIVVISHLTSLSYLFDIFGIWPDILKQVQLLFTRTEKEESGVVDRNVHF